MKKLFKNFAVAAAATALFSATAVMAEDKEPIKFTAAQDFTAVYTFVSSGYSQGQRDYITLINERGGIDGHKVELSVTDTGNEPQRGIEAYNRAKRDGTVLVDFFSTPVANAMVDRVLEDEIPMIMVLHGRGDASDGNTFPYLFPLSDRKSTRLNSSHVAISYAVFCLQKKNLTSSRAPPSTLQRAIPAHRALHPH